MTYGWDEKNALANWWHSKLMRFIADVLYAQTLRQFEYSTSASPKQLTLCTKRQLTNLKMLQYEAERS